MDTNSFFPLMLAYLVLLAQLSIFLWLILNILHSKLKSEINKIILRHGLLFSFVIALVATAGSLFFSEVIGLVPCELCWYQRILMYPLVILFGTGYVRRDRNISYYGAAYAGIGLIISGYHYLLQMKAAPATSCSINSTVSCANTQILYFGYITIPMMAFTAFLLIFLLHVIGLKNTYLETGK